VKAAADNPAPAETWSDWMRSTQGRLILVTLAFAAVGGVLLAFQFLGGDGAEAAGSDLTLAQIPFNGQRSYDLLQAICAIGPRPSGSAGMARQQKLLTDHFTALGGKVTRQTFRARHPQTGAAVPLANLLVEWHPERKERVLFCCHYDTRPFPDRDPVNPQGRFVGANDGASGAALLGELGRMMPQFAGKYGVDFLLVDGEEFVFSDAAFGAPGDPYFLGSEHFARDYRANPPPHKYVAAVVVDMIGDKELQICFEQQNMEWPESRPMVHDIWRTAARLGVKEFLPRVRHTVRDDHLALHDIAGIPTAEIIDFDYPRPGIAVTKYWHTEQDTPDKCSALSLAKVGWVLSEWLKSLK
jgi:hypothetical protein